MLRFRFEPRDGWLEPIRQFLMNAPLHKSLSA